MRTAIYVQELSTVTISVSAQSAPNAKLFRYNQAGGRPAVGTHSLERGIYMVISEPPVQVAGGGVETETARGDKDPLPGPKAQAQVIALEPGATRESIQQFFAIAKDV